MKTRVKYITDEHYEKITSWLKTDRSFDGILVDLLVRTGMRQSELVLLDRSTFNLSKPEIYIKATKDSEDRCIQFDIEMKPKLAFLMKNLNGKTIGDFISSGKPWQQKQNVRRAFHKVLKKAIGDNNYTVHSTRHTFAMRCFKVMGNDITKVQLVMGHKSIASTARYLKHVSICDLQDDLMKAVRQTKE